MNLHQYLLILRARYKLVVVTLLMTVALAVAVSVVLPKKYTATAGVVVDVNSPDPVAGTVIPAMILPAYMVTQREIITSDRVAQRVVKLLKFDEDPDVKASWMESTHGRGQLEVWLAGRLRKGLDVQPSRDSNVIEIAYTSPDPRRAANLSNAFAQAYLETTIEMKVEPAKQYALWFEKQGKTLRGQLELAQKRLSDYQQEHGIVATDERLDVETAKLNELSTQLTLVQAQMTDARNKQLSGSASSTLPEVVQNPLILTLKGEIARQEATLQELARNLGTNHPQYQRVESSIASLKRQLEVETQQITSGFSTAGTVGRGKEAELRATLGAQKQKLLELKTQRDQLAVLTHDVEVAQKAYDGVAQRFSQTSLESQFTQTNAAVLTPASEPLEPSFPKPLLNVALAIFLGTFLGSGLAFGLEILDRRIRSADDLAEMLQLPVLGVIPQATKRRPARLSLAGPRAS